jgi:hypothetical protein
MLEIPTVRKPRVSRNLIKKAAENLVLADVNQGKGPNTFKAMLQNELVMIPR